MKPKKMAEKLIADFVQMMPANIDRVGYDFKTQYEVAKVQAEYAAYVAKFSHKLDGKKFNYWKDVQTEIKKL